MLSFETACAFFVASLLMAMTPGPDVIIVLTQSSLYGMRAGVLTTLGLMTGLLGHTLAVALGEEPDTIEDVYEPYLIQLGFINRTPRGRVVTEAGYRHLGIPYPEK